MATAYGAAHPVGSFLLRYRPPRIALALLLAATALTLLSSGQLRLTPPRPFLGPALAAGGLVVMLAGWRLFVTRHVAICPTAHTARLITSGIYRVTRNPMYLGLVLIMLGAAVGVGSSPFYGAALAYFMLMDRVFCRYEEAKLIALFGEEYDAYRRRVRRWL